MFVIKMTVKEAKLEIKGRNKCKVEMKAIKDYEGGKSRNNKLKCLIKKQKK